ncbi:MAG: 2-oxo acid dehydrogenase subunit E2 [Treponema sp.]|jgi:pyruvate dehydrogenase E2 component (dihydrolipoamide acetyltransferase)|nr:2-oxo acid dehydrogenase subunit E2 [Treponema sp.]
MANSIIMPKTGMAMEEGVIIEWRVKEGDRVSKGDIVALIETDKSAMELESDYDGVILAILGKAGETVPVTKVIAWVGQSGEAVPAEGSRAANSGGAGSVPAAAAKAATNAAAQADTSGGVRATPAARALAKEKGIDLAALVPGGKYNEITRADVESTLKSAPVATPLAKRIAAAEGISLDGVQGSGFGGKIFSGDLAVGKSARRPAGAAALPDTRVALTNIQRVTGKRMSESRRTIPEVTLHIRADVTRLLELREELNNDLASSGAKAKITINDFVLAAAVRTLLSNPQINATLDGDALVYKGSVNLGMAVATGRGLLVPVIHNAQDYSLAELSAAAADLAAKAREGKLAPHEMSGGTFTVSNIGMFGINAFTPIINPPEAAILGVCAVDDELKLQGAQVVNRKKMGLSLAFDHRVVDGAGASIFLKNIKDILESPLLIVV